MKSRGRTDLSAPPKDLVKMPDRAKCRPDHDIRRNCLTSMYWIPTKTSPNLKLAVNKSDHVHFYQGGKPVEFVLVDPNTDQIRMQIVGPDILHGHVLQLAGKYSRK